jgi:16S rRNA (adenine1518-N6/adenine1519-N6)-dimethyltransferase
MIISIKKDLKDIKPNKRLGQNFLIDKSALNKIISAADLSKNDVVLEIGPGTGILTRELLKTAGKVIAVEKDKRMAEILKDNFKDYKNLEIINADALKIFNLQFSIYNQFSITKFLKNKYKVVANIPYYITSRLIRSLLETANQPELMVLLLQKEVAQRICARPRSAERGSPPKGAAPMNLLAVSVQFYAKPEIISYISKDSFWPKPKVDSAIIKITPGGPTSREAGGQTSPDLFFEIVKAGFKQPRKQLQNNISSGLRIEKAKAKSLIIKARIRPEQRPETLTVQNWIELTKVFML